MPTACFVSASGQNVFFSELLNAFADALAEHGIAVERAVDHFPVPRDGLVYVFVPHELLPLVEIDAHPTVDQLRRSITICTEQPGTQWFEVGAQVASSGGVAIDINALGVRALKERGIDARLLQLGYVPAWDHWGGDPQAERPVDLTFMGGETPRRVQALASCAAQLVGREAEIHLFETTRPHLANDPDFFSGARKWEALRRAKLILNIHRGELGYLEWQRVIGAMINGCVVVSEHSIGYEPLEPGRHLVSVAFDNVDIAVGALLREPDRIAQIRTEAYDFLRRELPLSASIHVLAEAVEKLAKRAPAASFPRKRLPVPRPRVLPAPPTVYERMLTERGAVDVVRMALKKIILDQQDLHRRLQALVDTLEATAPDDTVTGFGPDDEGIPRVSVVLTVYNYAGYVTEAIESVAAGSFQDVELVVVDDASTDASPQAIAATLERCPWLSATVVTKRRNGGLARARNTGVQFAQGEYVFILDADNAVAPDGLNRLVAALDAHPEAGFAYGLIEQFDTRGSIGVLSWSSWDPTRLRYGNVIDAMALIRRDVLLRAGGYTLDPRIHGWEDFDLWCTMADMQVTGWRVPQFVARYRVAAHSMISVTNIDETVAWSALIERHPSLSTVERSASGGEAA